MARKLDWNRTKAGRGGYDGRVGTEWLRGPVTTVGLSDDDSSMLPPDLLDPPDAFFPTSLARMFPEETGEAASRMKAMATAAAAEVYRIHGVNTLVSRVEAFHSRALAAAHFPCSWYAVYFDLAARRIALGRRAHDPAPRRRLDRFFGLHSAYARMIRVKGLVAHEGGPDAAWKLGRP